MFSPASQALLRVAPRVHVSGSVRTIIITSPPQVRISFGEKLGHGLLISTGILMYPIWAMLDIRKERLQKMAQE